MYTQVKALRYHLCDACKLIRNLLRYPDHALHVVVVLAEAAHALDMLRVVAVVVMGIHRGQGVEALHEHSFAIGVGKAHRSYHLEHTPLGSPLLHGLYQCLAYCQIIDEIEPSEAHDPLSPSLVSLMVDDGGHTAHHLVFFVSQEVISLTVLERCVLLFAQVVEFIEMQIGHIVGVVAVKIISELDECFQVLSRFNFFNFHV